MTKVQWVERQMASQPIVLNPAAMVHLAEFVEMTAAAYGMTIQDWEGLTVATNISGGKKIRMLMEA